MIWSCKIGTVEELPDGADAPMRAAVKRAFRELTGTEPRFLFSGWGAKLDDAEQDVIDREEGPAMMENGK